MKLQGRPILLQKDGIAGATREEVTRGVSLPDVKFERQRTSWDGNRRLPGRGWHRKRGLSAQVRR